MPSQRRLYEAYTRRGHCNASACHEFWSCDEPSRKRGVDGLGVGFPMLDQGVGRPWRRRRTHQGCIGCGEIHNQRRPPSPRPQPGDEATTDQQRAQVHLLVRPDRIFSSRPCSSLPHGAQGRLKAGRRASPRSDLDASRPALTGRAPCCDGKRPCRSSAWSKSFLLAAAGVTHGRKPRQRVPSRGHLRPRDSTRPEPEG
jgi:hypothetical protein